MSSQRGNVNKKGPPKHQNRHKFKNNLHDKSVRTKQILALDVSGVCQRCKDIIDWKIRYKKYKPLTMPKKCVKCGQKTVKRAYYIICQPCSTSLNVCAKCGESTDVVLEYGLDPSQEAKQRSELNFELANLSERKRRAFFRSQEKGDVGRDDESGSDDNDNESNTQSDCDRESISDGELSDNKDTVDINARVESNTSDTKSILKKTDYGETETAESSGAQVRFSDGDQLENKQSDTSRNDATESALEKLENEKNDNHDKLNEEFEKFTT